MTQTISVYISKAITGPEMHLKLEVIEVHD